MNKLRIGLVDLDTSHPGSFVPIIRSLGHEVACVFDSGTIYPQGYARKFADEHGIGIVCGSLDEMIEHIDVALIHSCNWDVHIERSRPFIEADKAIMIDKPIAGNLRDVQQILMWGRQGARITGGSSLLYCNEVQRWHKENDRADWVYGFAGCAVDEFNYGIHAYALLHGLVGPGVESVRHLGTTVQHQYEISWQDGRRGIVSVGTNDQYLPFYATTTTRKSMSHFQVDSSKLYRSFLEQVLPYLAGESPAPIALEDLLEPELSAIAAKISREQGGKRVSINDIPMDDPGYDGTAFAEFYRGQKLGIK